MGGVYYIPYFLFPKNDFHECLHAQLRLNRSSPSHSPPVFALPEGRTSYLQQEDLQRLAWGVAEVRRIMGSTPIADSLRDEVSPGARIGSDEELFRWIDANNYPNSHWVGSVRMGPEAPRRPASGPSSSSSSSSSSGMATSKTASAASATESTSSASVGTAPNALVGPIEDSALHPDLRVRGVRSLYVIGGAITFLRLENDHVKTCKICVFVQMRPRCRIFPMATRTPQLP